MKTLTSIQKPNSQYTIFTFVNTKAIINLKKANGFFTNFDQQKRIMFNFNIMVIDEMSKWRK